DAAQKIEVDPVTAAHVKDDAVRQRPGEPPVEVAAEEASADGAVENLGRVQEPRLGESRDAVDRGGERRVRIQIDGLGRHDAVDVDEAGQAGPRRQVEHLDL